MCLLPTQSLSIEQELIRSFALFSMQNHQLQRGYCYQEWMQIVYTSMVEGIQGRKLWFCSDKIHQVGESYYLIYCFADHVTIFKSILAFQAMDSSFQHLF